MIQIALHPHENATELADDMETLYGLLRQVRAFDSKAGDQIHTIVTRTHRVLRGLADELDPVLVSIVPVADPVQPEDDTMATRASRGTTFLRDVPRPFCQPANAG